MALFQNLIYRGFRREIAKGHTKDFLAKSKSMDIDYVCFRYEVLDYGELAGNSFFLSKGEGAKAKINLSTAIPDNTNPTIVSASILGGEEDWDDFYYINIKRLKRKTDRRLLTLE